MNKRIETLNEFINESQKINIVNRKTLNWKDYQKIPEEERENYLEAERKYGVTFYSGKANNGEFDFQFYKGRYEYEVKIWQNNKEILNGGVENIKDAKKLIEDTINEKC